MHHSWKGNWRSGEEAVHTGRIEKDQRNWRPVTGQKNRAWRAKVKRNARYKKEKKGSRAIPHVYTPPTHACYLLSYSRTILRVFRGLMTGNMPHAQRAQQRKTRALHLSTTNISETRPYSCSFLRCNRTIMEKTSQRMKRNS